MNMPKEVESLKDKVKKYLELPSLDINEKNMIFTLSKLLDLFYYYTKKDYSDMDMKEDSLDGSCDDIISEVKEEIEKFLDLNYVQEEFSILNVITFTDTSLFLSKLLQNLSFYLIDYKEEVDLVNIYYYLFHLIYYILSLLVNEKGKNMMNEDSIKFYIYHIVHFFLKDKKTPEYNFFFYEGALRYLSKTYNITFRYLFKFNTRYIIPKLIDSTDIKKIISGYRSKILAKKEPNLNEMNFLGNYSKVKDILNDQQKTEENMLDEEEEEEVELVEVCKVIKKKIEKLKEALDNYDVSCEKLNNYKNSFDNLIKIIEANELNEYHFDLMFLNYNYNKISQTELNRFLEMAQKWEKYNKSLEQDYTQTFSKIINSNDFQTLFREVMTSSHVKRFVKDKDLTKEYNIFIDKYISDIGNYVLYMPLTRGIKAYVSNYFRIILNTNSVDLIDIPDDKEKREILKSYLLIIMIHESFHFLFRLNKQGEISTKSLSPESKKIKETYSEIGVDIILHLFGTEYITFISKNNSELLNNLESWRNETTDFKVFKKIYFSGGELIGNENKNLGSGLRCNISVNENNSRVWMLCTDAAIRYCY